MNEDNDEEANGKDNKNLIFYTTTNLWTDAGRGDLNNDDAGNNDHKDKDGEQGQQQKHQQ